MTTQTEAQRLADWLQANYEADEIDASSALLRRQDELLEQALEKFELIVDGEDYGKIDGLITAIRAHLEAK